MKKSVVYWAGLIIVGLSVWALFIFFCIIIQASIRYPDSVHSMLIGPVILLAGAIIFLVIGTLMMKEGRGEGR